MLENLVDLRPSLPSMAMRGIPPLPQSAPISVLPIDSQLREVLSVHGYDRTVRPHLFDGSFQTGGMVFQRGFSNILRKDEVDKRHQNAGTPTPIVDATSFKVTPYFLQIGKRVLLMREGLYCGGSEGNFAIREQLLKYKFKLEDVVEANQNLSVRGNLLFFNFGEAELTNQLIAQHTIAAMLAIDLNPESIRDKYVVDLGCGTGILSVVADAYSPLHLAMVDNSKRSIEGAKDNVFQNTGLEKE
ncbi:MAG: methyltransferase [Patescibacteria group bacterium]